MGSTLPKNIKTLERTQRQAAIFCTQKYSREPGTVTQLLEDLQWDTLQTRRMQLKDLA